MAQRSTCSFSSGFKQRFTCVTSEAEVGAKLLCNKANQDAVNITALATKGYPV